MKTPHEIPATKWETFKILIMPFIAAVILVALIWYKMTHPDLDSNWFEMQGQIPDK